MVAHLIDQRADVTSQRNYGRTPLQLAAEQGHADVVKALVAARADTQVAGAYGRTPWTLACEAGHFQVVRVLVQAGAGRAKHKAKPSSDSSK